MKTNRKTAASYGMTDTMGRMHGDTQFAGSSSVPAHVEMMGSLEWVIPNGGGLY